VSILFSANHEIVTVTTYEACNKPIGSLVMAIQKGEVNKIVVNVARYTVRCIDSNVGLSNYRIKEPLSNYPNEKTGNHNRESSQFIKLVPYSQLESSIIL